MLKNSHDDNEREKTGEKQVQQSREFMNSQFCGSQLKTKPNFSKEFIVEEKN